MYTLLAPLRVLKTKTKWWSLNLNEYRNTHYQTLNETKIKYKAVMIDQVRTLPTFNKLRITYTLFPKTYKRCDISNICSIHDKYFSDILTELGKIPDDNYLYLPEVNYRFGGVDKLNPRVEIKLEEISNEN